jgi:hypothetical protein
VHAVILVVRNMLAIDRRAGSKSAVVKLAYVGWWLCGLSH